MGYPRRVALWNAFGVVVAVDVPVRQCAEGLDANPASVAHHPHLWPYKGRDRWCRGWFPTVSVQRSLIDYFQ